MVRALGPVPHRLQAAEHMREARPGQAGADLGRTLDLQRQDAELDMGHDAAR